MKHDIVFLVEQVYHGLQYVEYLLNNNIDFVIITRKNGPYKITNEKVIYEDNLNVDKIIDKIKDFLSKHNYKNIGILPGNDFCVPIAFSIAEKLGLKSSNNHLTGLYSRNKDLMRKQLASHNIEQPKSQKFSSLEELKKSSFDFPVVIKPSDMTGSSHVKLVYNKKELLDIANTIFSMKNNILGYVHNNIVLVEEFVEGPEFSIELFLEDGELIFSSVTEKQKGELPYFVETGHIVPSSITSDKQNELLIQAAYNASKAIEVMNGPVHAELVLTKDNIPKVIELTARIGGDNIMMLVKLATGVYLPELAIRQCLGEKIGKIDKKHNAAAIRFITGKPGIITSFDSDVIMKCKNIVDSNLSNIAIGKQVDQITSSDDRLGYIIAVGNSSKEAKSYAKLAEKKLNIIIK